MREVFITAARRSVVAPSGGVFTGLDTYALASPVIRACLDDAEITPGDVDEIIAGNALGAGGNPARMAALASGLPLSVAGLSIDRQCVSGLDAILMGRSMIASGAADVVVAGGVESHSTRPYRARVSGNGDLQPYERPPFAPDGFGDPDLPAAADSLGIPRADQDDWAIRSHRNARTNAETLAMECVPVIDGQGLCDPFARDLNRVTCARARVVHGNITAANMAVAADAAAFCVLSASPSPQALRIIDGLTTGSDPASPALAAIPAIQKLTLKPNDVDRFEIMEAFAAQTLATIAACDIDPDRVNLRGGALARGHPIAASGAILAVRLFHDLSGTGQRGLAAIAAAGGLGTSIALQGMG